MRSKLHTVLLPCIWECERVLNNWEERSSIRNPATGRGTGRMEPGSWTTASSARMLHHSSSEWHPPWNPQTSLSIPAAAFQDEQGRKHPLPKQHSSEMPNNWRNTELGCTLVYHDHGMCRGSLLARAYLQIDNTPLTQFLGQSQFSTASEPPNYSLPLRNRGEFAELPYPGSPNYNLP